MLIIVVI
jgi:hypothetical protein